MNNRNVCMPVLPESMELTTVPIEECIDLTGCDCPEGTFTMNAAQKMISGYLNINQSDQVNES